MSKNLELTEEQIKNLVEAFNPSREEQIKSTGALLAYMTMSRIINHEIPKTIKIFKNSMKEFSQEEQRKIECIMGIALLDPIEKSVRQIVSNIDYESLEA